MTDNQKAEEIALSFRTARMFSKHPCEIAEDAAQQMAAWKDEQPLVEQGGWHSESPTQDCFVLLETNEFPKNCRYIVAEWDNDAKCFYSESSDFPVKDWDRWKFIEVNDFLYNDLKHLNKHKDESSSNSNS